MPFYAVIDTNVLVSAFLKEHSIPRYVINYMYAGVIIPIYNDEIIAEYIEVLNRPKFSFPAEAVDTVIKNIQEIGLKIDSVNIKEIIPDPKDVVFFAVTMNSRRDFETYLVTGNIKDFPKKSFVITPHQMLDIIESNI